MEESPQPAWMRQAQRGLNVLFGALAVLAFVYIFWRGFAAESGRYATPLFGETTVLEWKGKQREFTLVRFADLATLKPGDLVIREREVPAVVWQVQSRETSRLLLARGEGAKVERKAIEMPPAEEPYRYVLLRAAQQVSGQ